jgi:DNA-binding transcriptional regulator YdaS (Cro superfamily)
MLNIEAMKIDTKITVRAALALFGSNQAACAKALTISRASVNQWVASDRKHIPALQAYRLQRMYPDKFPHKKIK